MMAHTVSKIGIALAASVSNTLRLQPETAEHKCEQHGPYQAFRSRFDGKLTPWTRCPECAKIEDAAIEAADKSAANALAAIRGNDKINRSRSAAGIPPRYANANLAKTDFDFLVGNERADAMGVLRFCRKYAANFDRAVDTGRSILLVGTPGTSKTHMACGIANIVLDSGRSAKYTTFAKLVSDVQGAMRFRSEVTANDVFAAYLAPDFLIIDEIGAGATKVGEAAMLATVLDERYSHRKPVCLASNLRPPGGDDDETSVVSRLGAPMIDRLREGGGALLPCAWTSIRKSGVDE